MPRSLLCQVSVALSGVRLIGRASHLGTQGGPRGTQRGDRVAQGAIVCAMARGVGCAAAPNRFTSPGAQHDQPRVKIDFALDICAGLFSAATVPNKKQTRVVYRARPGTQCERREVCDASQCSAWPRVAAPCCVAFIHSSRPCDHAEDRGAAFPLRSQGRPEWSKVVASSLGARVGCVALPSVVLRLRPLSPPNQALGPPWRTSGEPPPQKSVRVWRHGSPIWPVPVTGV